MSTQRRSNPFSLIFSRYYWLQIALIASAVILGVASSGMIMKELLIDSALEQEAAHYWQRLNKDPNAPLPDTKNLYGYRWQTGHKPEQLNAHKLQHEGVQRVTIAANEHTVIYQQRGDQHVLLVFGESNVTRLIWFFGLAPLMLSLIILYSALWLINRRTHNQVSPVTQLANALRNINLHPNQLEVEPFKHIDAGHSFEAQSLTQALSHYHRTLIDFIHREQRFTREVSHELRTPLSTLKNSLELIHNKYPNESSTLQRAQNSIGDMQQIVETLLAIAREATRPHNLDAQLINIEEVAFKVKTNLDMLAQARDMRIVIQPNSRLDVKAAPTLALMIISNLVRNALNYSHGTQVTITLDQQQLSISDDGVGLTSEFLHSIEMNHARSDTDFTPQGHGIGLKLVRRLCALLDWSVSIDNGHAKGLRVVLHLPQRHH